MTVPSRYHWPKILPPLTPEQKAISDDFMHRWHEHMPKRYSMFSRFRHRYAAQSQPIPPQCRTLEIGAGLGDHLPFENLRQQEYHCVDIRPNMLETLKSRFPDAQTHVADCQQEMPFPDGHFTRIIAMHILEHLPDLPAAISEMHRLLSKDGFISIVIPCDPGLLYALARKFSSARMFKKLYGQDYRWFIEREHINSPDEIISELRKKFRLSGLHYFPCVIPWTQANLGLGITARKL